jgi:hypothetical protein
LTTDERWLHETESLASYVVQHFYDTHSGFFWYSTTDDKQVFARKIEIYDGVIASGNSAMAHVLYTLGIFLHNDDYSEKARQMLLAMDSQVKSHPSAYANWASLALTVASEQLVVAVTGNDAATVIGKLKAKILPGTLIFGSRVESNLPYFENRYVEGKTLIYICSGTFCLAPVETAEEAAGLIASRKVK